MAALNFPTVGSELTYWLSHVGQSYSAHPGPQGQPEGERGMDFTLPYHTPVYAVSAGPVLDTGYYGGGGVVSVQMNGSESIYYQHLSDITVNQGDQVAPGQLIGYSGGQNGYGDHPADPYYSSWPHIEVGINGPWGGMWRPLGANINPLPTFHAMTSDTALYETPTGVGSTSNPTGNPDAFLTGSGTSGTPAVCTPPTGLNALNPIAWTQYEACLASSGAAKAGAAAGGSLAQQIAAGIGSAFSGIVGGISLNRVIKGLVGGLLIVSSIIILILPDAADVALSAAGAPALGEAVRQGLSHPLKSGTPGSVARTVSRTYNQRAQEKQQAARAYTNYQFAARQYQEKQQKQQIKEFQAFQTRRAATTKPIRGKLGATPNPMTREEVAQAQQKPAAPVLPTPKVQRGPKTGLRENLFTRGMRTVMTKTPIPDAALDRVNFLLRRKPSAADQERLTKREAKFDQPASNAPSINDIMKDLRGE